MAACRDSQNHLPVALRPSFLFRIRRHRGQTQYFPFFSALSASYLRRWDRSVSGSVDLNRRSAFNLQIRQHLWMGSIVSLTPILLPQYASACRETLASPTIAETIFLRLSGNNSSLFTMRTSRRASRAVYVANLIVKPILIELARRSAPASFSSVRAKELATLRSRGAACHHLSFVDFRMQ